MWKSWKQKAGLVCLLGAETTLGNDLVMSKDLANRQDRLHRIPATGNAMARYMYRSILEQRHGYTWTIHRTQVMQQVFHTNTA